MLVLTVLVALALIWPAIRMSRARHREAFAEKFAPCTPYINWADQQPVEVYFVLETDLSEQQLNVLPEVGSIEILSLVQCNAPAADVFMHIGKMTGLKALEIANMQIGDDVLRHLGGLHDLYALVLDRTNVSDRGLQYIRDLPSLAKLHLSDTNVTDQCIDYLEQMDSLREVYLSRTLVTPEGAERIRSALPDVDVYYAPPDDDDEEARGDD